MSAADDGSAPRGRRTDGESADEGITFSAAAASDSLEALAAERYARTPVIYLLIVGIVAIGCAALPLVHVPVSVRAAGMIRPSLEKLEIRSAVPGVVTDVAMAEGRAVTAGETLLRLSTPGDSARVSHLQSRRRELLSAISDLERLASMTERSADREWEPVLSGYGAELRSQRAGVAERSGRIERVRTDLARAERLLAEGLVPAADAERLRFQLAEIEAAEARIAAENRAAWARQLVEHRGRLTDVDRELEVLRTGERLTRISAPLNGTLEEVRPLARGSLVGAGERLATLSPDALLRVEAYLGPREVGLVRPGDRVLLRVDGHDPAEWGLLPGRVLAIGDDHVVVSGRAVFRIVISLDRDHLRRPDGRTGSLRKGTTVEARIVVARPSLYALLRGNLTDWVRPPVPVG